MKPGSFTVQEAAKLLNTSARNVTFWLTTGNIVKAAVDPGRRRSPKELSLLNLIELAVTKILAEKGLGLDMIRLAVATIPRSRISGAFGPEPKGWLLLVFKDKEREWGVFVDNSQKGLASYLADAAANTKVAVIVNVTNVIRELEQAVRDFNRRISQEALCPV